MVVRDNRRKSRSWVELKQNCGVNAGGSYDLGGMSSLRAALCFDDDEGDGIAEDETDDDADEDEGALFQNQEAVV